jgi:hypothetical protein
MTTTEKLTAEVLKPLSCNVNVPNVNTSVDDTIESASSTSGKSGSGIGYNADCSGSDDQSSDGNTSGESKQRRDIQQIQRGLTTISINHNSRDSKDAGTHKKQNNNTKFCHDINEHKIKKQLGVEHQDKPKGRSTSMSHDSSNTLENRNLTNNTFSFPQWNGIHITNPTDFRFDVSAIQKASHLSKTIPSNNSDQPNQGGNLSSLSILSQQGQQEILNQPNLTWAALSLDGLYGFSGNNNNNNNQNKNIQQPSTEQATTQQQLLSSDIGQLDVGLESYIRLLEVSSIGLFCGL